MVDPSQKRLPNFNAGPAAMPKAVLETLRDDMLDYRGRGLSVLEMSHRSADFAEIAARAEQNLRQLLAIPDHYSVLFMQGGASAQFALTVRNLDDQESVAYANTGIWSRKAIRTASVLTQATEVVSCTSTPRIAIPSSDTWQDTGNASFVHITDNETIDGVVFAEVPEVGAPLVADMSSSILSRPIDVTRYGVIYAGAQKNIGPAGITVLIIRDDLLDRSASVSMPDVFNYAAMAKAGSMLNTPPTFAWYTAGLVFEWLIEQGGLSVVAERNERQAQAVYAAIDRHDVYENTVHEANRSIMNIPFRLRDEALTEQFLSEAARQGFIGLKGHKSVGGARASLYNAVTDEAVDALVEFMAFFAQEHA